MSPIVVEESARVFRAGGRRWFTRSAAIKAYAREKFRKKHPCECEAESYGDGYPGYTCGVHDAWERIGPRYLRLLKRYNSARAVDAVATSPQEGKAVPSRKEEHRAGSVSGASR